MGIRGFEPLAAVRQHTQAGRTVQTPRTMIGGKDSRDDPTIAAALRE